MSCGVEAGAVGQPRKPEERPRLCCVDGYCDSTEFKNACPFLVEAEVQYLLNYVKRLREESGFVQAALIVAKLPVDFESN